MTEAEFWKSNPHKLKPHAKAFILKQKNTDQQMWIMGQYVLSAVSVAVEHNLAGRKAKSKYIKEPMMNNIDETINMSPEEIREREIRKAIANERQWSIQAEMKNLPAPFEKR